MNLKLKLYHYRSGQRLYFEQVFCHSRIASPQNLQLAASSMRNQVFISYRHESPEHSRKVRGLGEMLRQAGLPVMLDQFYLEEHPGGPDDGWPKWSEDCANES